MAGAGAGEGGVAAPIPVRVLATLEVEPRLLGMFAAVAVVWIALDLLTGGVFLSARNLYNLSVQSSVVGIMASGMVLVIVSRHIDLAVGSTLGFTGMAIAVLQVDGWPAGATWAWPLTVLVGLALGAAIGAWQGYWVAYRGLPAFVVTLAGLLVFRGGAYLLTDGRTVAPLEPGYQMLGGGLEGSLGGSASWALAGLVVAALTARSVRRMTRGTAGGSARPGWAEALVLAGGVALVLGFVAVVNATTRPGGEASRGVPVPVLILAGVAAGTSALARATRFGRHVFALGGSPEAAELAGIDVRRVTLGVFVLMGLLGGVAAIVTTARLGAGTNSMGTLAELSVIAAAVIGGTSLRGGIGSVAGAILGAVLMQSLDNGMVLLGVSSPLRQIFIGLVLIAAVQVDVAPERRRTR